MIEPCFICRIGIAIDEEDFCKISDYKRGKHKNSIYCHPTCWRNHMSNKEMLRKSLEQTSEVAGKLNKMIPN